MRRRLRRLLVGRLDKLFVDVSPHRYKGEDKVFRLESNVRHP